MGLSQTLARPAEANPIRGGKKRRQQREELGAGPGAEVEAEAEARTGAGTGVEAEAGADAAQSRMQKLLQEPGPMTVTGRL